MRRRGHSPQWLEEKSRIRLTVPKGVEHAILISGECPLWAWQVDRCHSSFKLARLTGIEVWHLIDICSGHAIATTTEIDAIAAAILVDPDLLQAQMAEYELEGRAQELREKLRWPKEGVTEAAP